MLLSKTALPDLATLYVTLQVARRTTMTGLVAQLLFLAITCGICFSQIDFIGLDAAKRILEVSPSSPSIPLPDRKMQSLNIDVDLVLVPVTVTDAIDRLVIGLGKDRFSVYDNGNREDIRYFSAEDAPISFGLILDTSSSMTGKIETAREAAVQLLRIGNPEDEFFLIHFNDRPEVLADFTSSVESIQGEVGKLRPNGSTALLDAVYFGLDHMRKAKHRRKVMLIISDGGDNHSRYNRREVFSRVKEAGVQIYALGIFDEAPKTKAERSGPDLLSALTTATGGRTLRVRNLKSICDFAGKLAVELRNQYVIAYRPSSLVRDGSWHRVVVRVDRPTNPERLYVYSSAGYYAPKK